MSYPCGLWQLKEPNCAIRTCPVTSPSLRPCQDDPGPPSLDLFASTPRPLLHDQWTRLGSHVGKWPGALTPCAIQARGFACLHSSFLGAKRVNKTYLWGREGGARGEITPPLPPTPTPAARRTRFSTVRR